MARILALLSFLAILAATPVQAADTAASPISSLRDVQASVYAIVREFHMQTMLSGDPSRTAQVKAAVDKAGAALARIQPGNDAALAGALKDARPAWQAFAKLAVANNIAKDGFTDDNLIADLYQAAATVDAALGRAIKAIPAAGKQRANADRAHAANLLLQRAVASYLKRLAQMSPDVGASEDFDIGVAVKTLDREIAAMARELKSNAAMPGVHTKWNFIRGSLANYNEKSVPFIVDRYAAQINEGLETVARDLDGQ